MEEITETSEEYKEHISVYSKARYTVSNAVISPKDPLVLDQEEKRGIVYECGCEACDKLHIGDI